MTGAPERKRKTPREALADAWNENRDAWDGYVAGMGADWSAFVDHEHTAALAVLGDEHAAALGVWGHELTAAESALGLTKPVNRRPHPGAVR